MKTRLGLLNTRLWRAGRDTTLPAWQALPLVLFRALVLATRDVAGERLNLRAMSLVYTTLLSLVPLLAVSFSVLKAFGVHNAARPALLALLAPLGDERVQMVDQITGFVDNIKVGVLGVVGVAMLLYTAVSLVQKVEQGFNEVWHVRRERTFAQRFSNYLSVIFTAPVLLFAIVSIGASVFDDVIFSWLGVRGVLADALRLLQRMLPLLILVAVFSFIYSLVPNTRVRNVPALTGAIVAALLWQMSGMLFAQFVAGASNYVAVYSGFAIVIVFMLWIYVIWLIVLFGASVAFYMQNPGYSPGHDAGAAFSPRQRERIALAALGRLAHAHAAGVPGLTPHELALALRLPEPVLEDVLAPFLDQHLVARTDDPLPRWLPAVEPASVPLADLLIVLRLQGEQRQLHAHDLANDPALSALESRLDECQQSALGNMTWQDLAGDQLAPSSEKS
ncbi:MAG: YihY/virulence factor BrkB family protein [Gammaproteobacteria bacterium]|nr:YihY/virulence factor BrkB family protein [Gammaproteobacteria bacterium]